MNLRGQVASGVLSVENSEGEGQLNLGVTGWMVFISLEVQLLGILSILDMSPLAILFLAVT